MKPLILAVVFSALLGAARIASAAYEPDPDPSGKTSQIVDRYLHATGDSNNSLYGASMEVDIDASVPKLQENGRLHALRIISRMGRISYRVLGFQGSNTVKNQIISRYLQAEQQSQANSKMDITPVNYRFRSKGVRRTSSGEDVFVLALSPRKAGPGLFKGEMWLDSNTCLPVYEKGRLVKNPSIFFKKVDFERAFAIRNGKAVPQHMSSVITTRLVGTVELDVNYTNFSETLDDADGGAAAFSLTNFAQQTNFAQ